MALVMALQQKWEPKDVEFKGGYTYPFTETLLVELITYSNSSQQRHPWTHRFGE